MEKQSGFCEVHNKISKCVTWNSRLKGSIDITWDTDNLWNCTEKPYETQYAYSPPPPRRLQKLSESDKAESSDRRKFWLKQNIFTTPDASSAEKITDLSLHISKQSTCKIKDRVAQSV